MNYAAHYERLVERARERVLSGYRERHHVLPRCLGGGDEPENIVELTAEEHMVAHLLLIKLHPGNTSIFYAAHMMRLAPGQMAGRSANKRYSWLRKRHALATVATHTGRKHTPEARAKMSASHVGKTNRLGAKHSPEARAKMSAAKRGKPMPPLSMEARKKRSAAMLGKKIRLGHRNSPEHRERIAAALRGKPFSAERIAKISAANKGCTPWNKGKRGGTLSPEHRAKLSAARMGRVVTAETRRKISEANRGKKRAPAQAAQSAARLRAYWAERRMRESAR